MELKPAKCHLLVFQTESNQDHDAISYTTITAIAIAS